MAERVGFTGTRYGMNDRQVMGLREILAAITDEKREFHHGDCVGSDSQAARVAKALGFWVVSHPPTVMRHRAHAPSDLVLPPRRYLDRNEDIVDGTDGLIAAPRELEEVVRSGTWHTVRYARRKDKPVTMLWRL